MEDSVSEGRLLVTFEKHQEFAQTQQILLSLDVYDEPDPQQDRREISLLSKLSDTLNEYQEQPYLLDPFIEQLVTPVVEAFKDHARRLITSSQAVVSHARVDRLAHLLYNYIKFRGYKAITRFFPHEVSDLPIALEYIFSPKCPVQDPSQWPLRYVVILWLSLICMIPFDLEQFDESDRRGETVERIQSLGQSYLDRAGLEREGAAILLSKLYIRKDTSARFPAFLERSMAIINCSNNPFPCIGLLQVLCEITKSGSVEQVKSHLTALLDVANAVQSKESLMNNTLIRKLHTKLVSRIVLRLLPARFSAARRRGRILTESTSGNQMASSDYMGDTDYDVPQEVETVLEDLFKALQDKDTIVRWSAAKGIARISERLPSDFAEQVLDTVIGLFSIHTIAAASLYDMPSIAEGTWHGACLACAEIARRGLVADDKLAELIGWLSKALYFDIRKGAHSTGSNVRDAASYVLWSLARAQSISALAPHAEDLSRRLVVVACFDREVHIRRAASATFQEFVGRTSLFTHGIDVLRKTDFYAVGVRRNAFLVAAPEVAEHEVYRGFLLDHLLNVTLRHWDPNMRQLGAQSLRAITELDLAHIGPSAARKTSQFLRGPDSSDIHGALVALAELAAAFRDAPSNLAANRREVFAYLSLVPMNMVESPRQELVTSAACVLIASGITLSEIQSEQSSKAPWRKILDIGLRSRSIVVQEAAASAMESVSKVVNCSAVVDRLVREFQPGPPQLQQSLCRVLGVLDYNSHPHGLLKSIRCLLECVDKSAQAKTVSVEARRNAYFSMSEIVSNVSPNLGEQLEPAIVSEITDSLLLGLTDYTSDERGDVGSWVRIACVNGLALLAETLFPHAEKLSNFAQYFSPSKYHDAIGGILKQGVERLDNVRQQAGECFIRLLLLPLPKIADSEEWRIQGNVFMKSLFLAGNETIRWADASQIFPKAVQLLHIQRYREAVLAGIVLSVSTKTDSTQRPVSASLVTFASSLPISPSRSDEYDLLSLVQDLLSQAKSNLSSNNVVIPVLQTLNVLLEANVFQQLSEDATGLQSLRSFLDVVSKNVDKLKNHQRILMSMRTVANLISLQELRNDCISKLQSFLTHQYPKVRIDTAEHLYLVLQRCDLDVDTDKAEEILLQTAWSSSEQSAVHDAAQRVVSILLNEDMSSPN